MALRPAASSAIGRLFQRVLKEGGAVPFHVALMAVTVLVYAAQFAEPKLQRAGACDQEAILKNRQWHRLVSSVFLHNRAAHLFFNMYLLYILGGPIASLFGPSRSLCIYLLSGLCANIPGLWFGSPGLSVGASGAVFGLEGAIGGYWLQNGRAMGFTGQGMLRNVGEVLLLNLLMSSWWPGQSIDNVAHVAGALLSGVVLGAALTQRFRWVRFAGLHFRVSPQSFGDGSIIPAQAVQVLLPALVVAYAVGIGQAVRTARRSKRVERKGHWKWRGDERW